MWVYNSNCALFVPQGAVENYLVDWWWNFASPEQDPLSSGLGIYEIGACIPATALNVASFSTVLTWRGQTDVYNIIFSETELSEEALATREPDVRITNGALQYDFEMILEKQNVRYYVYVQGECSQESHSKWSSNYSFYYTTSPCEWTVYGYDNESVESPYGTTGFGGGWDAIGLEFWQMDALIAQVKGDASLDSTAKIRLFDGFDVTIKWIGYVPEDTNGFPNTFFVKDGEGNIVVERNDVMDTLSETIGTYNVDCGGTGPQTEAIEKSSLKSKITVIPTLSNGFVTVSGATANSTVKVMNSRGQYLKSEAIGTDSKRIELNYANGLYFIVVQNGQNTVTEKVILKR
jgi:hypothetical protein